MITLVTFDEYAASEQDLCVDAGRHRSRPTILSSRTCFSPLCPNHCFLARRLVRADEILFQFQNTLAKTFATGLHGRKIPLVRWVETHNPKSRQRDGDTQD